MSVFGDEISKKPSRYAFLWEKIMSLIKVCLKENLTYKFKGYISLGARLSDKLSNRISMLKISSNF